MDLAVLVGLRTDDHDAVQEVEREAMRRAVRRPSDPGVAPVARHDDDGCQLVLERAVDVREAFDVQHVDLVDEQHARDNLGFALLFPLADFRVDLIPDFAADLARVP